MSGPHRSLPAAACHSWADCLLFTMYQTLSLASLHKDSHRGSGVDDLAPQDHECQLMTSLQPCWALVLDLGLCDRHKEGTKCAPSHMADAACSLRESQLSPSFEDQTLAALASVAQKTSSRVFGLPAVNSALSQEDWRGPLAGLWALEASIGMLI